MLQSLHVKNLALIDEIEVQFEKGLNILTGETGAGKSIILGSVNLALGGRYTKDMLREGAEYGFVELVFSVEESGHVKKLKEMDIYPEDGQVILSRRLMEGRSVSRINGEAVQMTALKEAAAVLIDVHGQHEHQSLLYKKNHIGILDAFANEWIEDEKNHVSVAWKTYRVCKQELLEADKEDSQREKELSFLRFEVKEIQEAALKEQEDQELEEHYRRMLNSKKIISGVHEAYTYTADGETSASEALSRAIRSLTDASDCDERAAELRGQLVEVDSLLNDFNRELSEYEKACEFSEEEFYEIENRLNEVNHLKQKYGNTIADILVHCEEQEKKINILEDYENYIKTLKESFVRAEKELVEHCRKLSAIRKKRAKTLEREIQSGLKELNFSEVMFQISFQELKDYTEQGIDEVEFLISMNPGQPVKPLVNVASGGELSRIMLAIKTVMADKDAIETLIFDEIDVGISGRTAQKVSEKMAIIGKKRQVICITHLAQIAAMADAHYAIEKKTANGAVKTEIRMLSEEKSIQELARILGGAKITDAVLQNAAEMKELAKHTK